MACFGDETLDGRARVPGAPRPARRRHLRRRDLGRADRERLRARRPPALPARADAARRRRRASSSAGSTRSASTPAAKTASSGPRPRPRCASSNANAGSTPDGVCGPATHHRARVSVGSLAAARSPAVRERDTLRRAPAPPRRPARSSSSSTPALARARARRRAAGCVDEGAIVALDAVRRRPRACSPRRPTRSAPTCASRSPPATEPGARCAYFAQPDLPLRGRALPRATA